MNSNQRLLEVMQELARREQLENTSIGVIPENAGESSKTVAPQEIIEMPAGPEAAEDFRLIRLEEIKAELAKRKELENHGETSGMQDFIKGFVTGPASFLDLMGEAEKRLRATMAPNTPQFTKAGNKPKTAEEIMAEPSIKEQAEHAFHQATGIPEPEPGTKPSFSQTAGEILSPSLLSKFVNPLTKGIVPAIKAGAKALGEATGTATALHHAPNITEEGSIGEDIAKTIGGAYLGGKTAGAIGTLPKLVPTKTNLARLASVGTSPNTEALELAEKHGIDLPINVGLNSTPLNWAANTLSKTIFANKKYKEALQRTNNQMLNKVKENIDVLGKEDVLPEAAGQNFNQFLKDEETAVRKTVDAKYDEARVLLKPSDSVVPHHTAKSIHDMKEILERDIKSPSTKKVTALVAELASSWDILPKKFKLPKGYKEGDFTPETLSTLLNSFENNRKAIPLEKLEGVRKELGQIIGYGEVRGMDSYLKGIRDSIGKDLELSHNAAYVDKLKDANRYYRESYATRFKEDIAESILKGETPLYTYSKLNNETLPILETIAGNSPKAKEIVNSLKKAKAREIFNNAFKEEGVHLGNFTRVFDKNEVNQGFLRKLLGPESYKNLHEISKIMKEQSKAGRELLNTSGTAYTTADINTLSKLGVETSTALISIFSGRPYIALGAVGSAAIRAGIPNAASLLLSDPAFIKKARAFAVARQRGNIPYSNQLLESLGKQANLILKTGLISKYSSEEEKEYGILH